MPIQHPKILILTVSYLYQVKCETPEASQEDGFENRSDCSPLITYSNGRHNDKVRHGFAKEKPSQSVANCSWPCSREASFRGSGSSNLDGDKVLKKRKATQGGNENELVDLFEEISAEQLLIEPGENYVADSEVMSSTPVCEFNRKEWLEKLAEEAKDEKVPGWGEGTKGWGRGERRSEWGLTRWGRPFFSTLRLSVGCSVLVFEGMKLLRSTWLLQ